MTGDSACRGCTHFGPYRTCFEPVLAGLATAFVIVFPEPTYGAACAARQAKARSTTSTSTAGASR